MKTTIDIAEPLLQRARKLAARRGTTLKAVIEEALRETLERQRVPKRIARLQTHVFTGKGLRAGLSWSDWSAMNDLGYEGRGA